MKCIVCSAEVKGNYWTRIKAYEAGWFQKRDGDAWCPAHLPDWVAPWRGRVRHAK